MVIHLKTIFKIKNFSVMAASPKKDLNLTFKQKKYKKFLI